MHQRGCPERAAPPLRASLMPDHSHCHVARHPIPLLLMSLIIKSQQPYLYHGMMQSSVKPCLAGLIIPVSSHCHQSTTLASPGSVRISLASAISGLDCAVEAGCVPQVQSSQRHHVQRGLHHVRPCRPRNGARPKWRPVQEGQGCKGSCGELLFPAPSVNSMCALFPSCAER